LNPRQYTAQGSSGLLIDAYTRGKAIGAYATREGTLRYKITVHVELQALAVTNAHKVYPLLSGHRRVKSCPTIGVNEKFQFSAIVGLQRYLSVSLGKDGLVEKT
jgi:hypothetical protein